MKKTLALLSLLLIVGAGCQLPTKEKQESLDKKDLDYYINNFSSAPMISVVELEKERKLSRAFSVKKQTIACNPTDENDENFLCCNQKTKTYTPTIDFYTLEPMIWKAGGNRDFYIDATSGMCADGGLMSVRGPFYDNLLDLSMEAETQGKIIEFDK